MLFLLYAESVATAEKWLLISSGVPQSNTS